jgi:hypothetical protein
MTGSCPPSVEGAESHHPTAGSAFRREKTTGKALSPQQGHQAAQGQQFGIYACAARNLVLKGHWSFENGSRHDIETNLAEATAK